MRHRPLGRTALQVSELCLGTMNFGPNTSEADSFELLDRALDLDLGIDFVDTADQYGVTFGVGATETILGNSLAQGGERREQIVSATKLYEPMSDRANDRGLSERHIRRACEASLRRLQTDHIDVDQMLGESPGTVGLSWLLHRPGVSAPIVGPRTMQQLDEAVHATTVVLTDQVLARLDEILPGPGPAPEAYAW